MDTVTVYGWTLRFFADVNDALVEFPTLVEAEDYAGVWSGDVLVQYTP